MQPDSLDKLLQKRLRKVKAICQRDMVAGWGHVQMPDALTEKILTPLSNGDGSGSFLKRSVGRPPGLVRKAAFIAGARKLLTILSARELSGQSWNPKIGLTQTQSLTGIICDQVGPHR